MTVSLLLVVFLVHHHHYPFLTLDLGESVGATGKGLFTSNVDSQ
jgi:hypothetical protein